MPACFHVLNRTPLLYTCLILLAALKAGFPTMATAQISTQLSTHPAQLHPLIETRLASQTAGKSETSTTAGLRTRIAQQLAGQERRQRISTNRRRGQIAAREVRKTSLLRPAKTAAGLPTPSPTGPAWR